MADIDSALYHRLTTYAGLASLVSTRVSPVTLPQDVSLPAVVFQNISLVPAVQEFDGPAALPKARYQITSFGGTLASAKAVAAQVRAALDGERGEWGTGAYKTVIYASLWKDESDVQEPDLPMYLVQQDYLIMFRD